MSNLLILNVMTHRDEYKQISVLNSAFTGDQVLEWNGEPLTGKSYEEVKDITSYCNGGEVELVVRP